MAAGHRVHAAAELKYAPGLQRPHVLQRAWYLATVFTEPEPCPEFIAAWQRKVIHLMAILGRARSQSGDIAERKERVAYRLLNTLLRQRDAIQARALTSRR